MVLPRSFTTVRFMVVNRIFAQIKAGPMSGPSAAYDEPPESVGELDDEALSRRYGRLDDEVALDLAVDLGAQAVCACVRVCVAGESCVGNVRSRARYRNFAQHAHAHTRAQTHMRANTHIHTCAPTPPRGLCRTCLRNASTAPRAGRARAAARG